jgi:hypothetical protein
MVSEPPNADVVADEESVEIEPRPAALVARRATLIAALLRRAALEVGLSVGDPEAERFDLGAWTASEGLPALATTEEAETFTAPLGALDPIQIDQATWEAEALVALAWALGLVESIPPYDEIADPLPALNALPAPWDSLAQFARSAKLRPVDDLATERERAEVWRWRALAEMTRRDGTPEEKRDVQTMLRDLAGEASASGLIPPLVDGDFAVKGRPYRRISDEDLDELAELAFQRLRALNWACGFGDSWQDPSLDVE